jgi:predicted negative regulator of RcsB-dependent stress response
MAYDIEQQESLASMKAWFDANANWMIGILLVVTLGFTGNWAWRWYQTREGNAASALYDQYEQAVVAKDPGKARDAAAALTQQYPSSAYASFAALNQARVSLEAGDNAAAKAQLQWVVDKSGNKELQALARIRLAGVLLDEKSYDQGLAVLKDDVPAALAAEFSDRRGDLLFAQGKLTDARAAYAKALEQASAQNPLRQLIQSKLDALPTAG